MCSEHATACHYVFKNQIMIVSPGKEPFLEEREGNHKECSLIHVVIIYIFPSLFQERKKGTKPSTLPISIMGHKQFLALVSTASPREGAESFPGVSACAAAPGWQCDSHTRQPLHPKRSHHTGASKNSVQLRETAACRILEMPKYIQETTALDRLTNEPVIPRSSAELVPYISS